VPYYSFRRLPWCGTCGAALGEPFQKRITRQIYRGRYLIITLACLGSLAIWSPQIPSIDFSSAPSKALKDTCANYPQPDQGLYARYTRRPDVAPLILKTRTGSNYFVKIDDAGSGRTVLTFCIYGGSSIETQVPRGTYTVKYATGTQWCGEPELFGASTATNKADRIFQFDDDHEYTIELILQTNGNLATKRISRQDF
jgi:hypothetical protein